MNSQDITKALQTLRPKAEWILRGDSLVGLEWLDSVQTRPIDAEILAQIAVLIAAQGK